MVKPLGLYLHIPFCKQKCAYCSFYSAAAKQSTIDEYCLQLAKKIKEWGGRTDRPIDTLYLGGGTPSLLSVNQITDIISTVKQSFTLSKDAEITLELNPENIDEAYLKGIKSAGVNRLSIGVQSTDDKTLAFLGRRHTFLAAKTVFSLARKVGFTNISVDIMLAIPNQTELVLEKTLSEVADLNPEHISCYIFSLEENTIFYKRKDTLNIPDDDTVAKQYLSMCDFLCKKGYNHYEISNFSKNGAESKHNNKYWRDEEYIGIGPSAYSFFEGKRFHYENNMACFYKGDTAFDEIGGDLEEYIMLKLRLKEGISQIELRKKFGVTFNEDFIKIANTYKQNGFVNFNGENLSLTENGMLLSNTIINTFTAEELYEKL